MKQLHVLLVPLVLITSSYVFSVFVCGVVCVCVWCVCVCMWVCGCVHSCQQRVRSADGVNSDANSLASGASINEAATCITCAIGIDYLLVCILCVCVCVCVCGVCVWCVCVLCVCVGVSILASRGSDQLMV